MTVCTAGGSLAPEDTGPMTTGIRAGEGELERQRRTRLWEEGRPRKREARREKGRSRLAGTAMTRKEGGMVLERADAQFKHRRGRGEWPGAGLAQGVLDPGLA